MHISRGFAASARLLATCAVVASLAACGGSSGSGNAEAPPRNEPDLAQEKPLLGSRRGGHLWFDYCSGKPDDALLPADPRSLVVPGVSAGRAVHFNAYWQDCHLDPEAVGEQPHPKTCGELRQSVARGAVFMSGNGTVGAATSFNGQGSTSTYSIAAENYANLWRVWGLTARPDNFDQLASERFGSPLSDVRNPYPLPGEDPNQTNGGSGQLPLMLTQLRNEDGSWTGRLSTTCALCHGSQVGTAQDGEGLGVVYGMGNATQDLAIVARDLALAGAPANAVLTIFARQRGNNNASFFNLLSLGAAQGTEYVSVLTSGSTATEDTPPWWNMGSRPFKFWDGLYPSDGTRVDMAFYRGGDDPEGWTKAHAQDADQWILNRKAPAYPFAIDTHLAEVGAILFHTKDLWATPLNNPRPRPDGGNGSCASCHGAYSPRFVHDERFIATPALEGIAGYVVPHEIIGTDPIRQATMDEDTTRAYSRTFSTYPESRGTDYDCGPRTLPELAQGRRPGYLAPPLYGVWATAPYLHNGSVPDMWALLKPDERPEVWRRVSTPARPDQEGRVVMGFDTDLHRAYDPSRMGWKHDALQCGSGLGTVPLLQCGVPPIFSGALVQQAFNAIFRNVFFSWNVANAAVLTEMTPAQMEARKIYNTHFFGQGNQGHDFTVVLTDLERRALIEYMKTL